jgi:hypothetical protein
MPVQKRRSFSSIERPSALAGGAKTLDHDFLTSFRPHKHMPIHNCIRMYNMDVGCSLKGSTASRIA